MVRRKAYFVASEYSPGEPRNPRALSSSIFAVYRVWEAVQQSIPFMEYAQDTSPSRASILAVFDDMVAVAREGDTFMFVYSGHGASLQSVECGDSTETDGQREAIVPDWAVSPDQFVCDDEVCSRLRKLPHGVFVLCIFGACHSESICDMPYTYYDTGMSRLLHNPGIPDLAADVAVLSSCRDSELTVAGKAAPFDLAVRDVLLQLGHPSVPIRTLGAFYKAVREACRRNNAPGTETCCISFSRAGMTPGTLFALLPGRSLDCEVATVAQDCPTNDDNYLWYNIQRGSSYTVLDRNRVRLKFGAEELGNRTLASLGLTGASQRETCLRPPYPVDDIRALRTVCTAAPGYMCRFSGESVSISRAC